MNMSKNQTPVVFTGDAGDYFGIWMVNLMLSIITLGIYSAWAKVRRKKYFYNNTLIDGVGFDYHANPIAILKGRIIAFILLVLYTVLSSFDPSFGLVLALLLSLAVPWIVVRGMMFNARNTSHRGLRFDFDGTSGQAALIFIAYPLLALLTLGLAVPFVAQRTHKFLFDHHKFGLSHFQMNALVKDFYLIYLKLVGVLIVIGIVITVAINSLVGDLAPAPVSLKQPSYRQTATAPIQQGGFIKVAATTAEPVVQDAPIAAEPPESTTEQPNNSTKKKDPVAEAIEKYVAQFGAVVYLMILGGLLLYMLVILLVVAYMQSRIANLVLNNTSLEHVRFFANQRMRDLVWLYLSNIMLLMFTGGLAIPWTHIRMARYRAEHLAITGETDWDQFVGEKKESSRAVGEELADMFDIDISFG
jgi:uncharacterized membrane protein YjgN (DUF898 family)